MNQHNSKIQKYILSKQYKQALYNALSIAKEENLSSVNLLCLFYGLLKTESTLSGSIFDKLFYSRKLTKATILTEIKKLIKQNSKSQTIVQDNYEFPTLQKNVREVIVGSICQTHSLIITTDQLFLSLLSQQKIKDLISKLIFEV